jgi:hypothetical protein
MSGLPTVDSKRNLKYYQLLAFGALGLYVYQLSKHQNKSLLGGEPVQVGKFKLQMNAEKMVDSVSPWIALEPTQKTLVVTALKDFLRGLKNG